MNETDINKIMLRMARNAKAVPLKLWRQCGFHGFPPPGPPITLSGPLGTSKHYDVRKKYTHSDALHEKYWR